MYVLVCVYEGDSRTPVGSRLKPYQLQCVYLCLSPPLEQNWHCTVWPISHIAPHFSLATTVGHLWKGGEGGFAKPKNSIKNQKSHQFTNADKFRKWARQSASRLWHKQEVGFNVGWKFWWVALIFAINQHNYNASLHLALFIRLIRLIQLTSRLC